MDRNPRSAEKQKSIWRDIPENVFRSHLIRLSKLSKEVPAWPKSNLPPLDIRSNPEFKVECMIAQDFAFLAAVQEGVESVSAACVMHVPDESVVIRIASNQGVPQGVRDFFAEIVTLLQQCSRRGRKVETTRLLPR